MDKPPQHPGKRRGQEHFLPIIGADIGDGITGTKNIGNRPRAFESSCDRRQQQIGFSRAGTAF